MAVDVPAHIVVMLLFKAVGAVGAALTVAVPPAAALVQPVELRTVTLYVVLLLRLPVVYVLVVVVTAAAPPIIQL
jgi:hypothetical protein